MPLTSRPWYAEVVWARRSVASGKGNTVGDIPWREESCFREDERTPSLPLRGALARALLGVRSKPTSEGFREAGYPYQDAGRHVSIGKRARLREPRARQPSR